MHHICTKLWNLLNFKVQIIEHQIVTCTYEILNPSHAIERRGNNLEVLTFTRFICNKSVLSEYTTNHIIAATNH